MVEGVQKKKLDTVSYQRSNEFVFKVEAALFELTNNLLPNAIVCSQSLAFVANWISNWKWLALWELEIVWAIGSTLKRLKIISLE